MNKKGYFFSLDALMALIVIVGVILVVKPSYTEVKYESSAPEDLLVVLSSLEIGEIDSAYVSSLIASGKITNLNQSVLEQIGEFYATLQPEDVLLAQSIIDDLNLNENLGIYFNNEKMAGDGSLVIDDANQILTRRQIISGIQQGNSTGFSSRAFLTTENKVDYFYFGGYVGDGNLSFDVGSNVIGAKVEAVFSGDFDLYINDVFAESYTPLADTPYEIELSNHLNLFNGGGNNIAFRADEKLYIAGGFIKITYNDSSGMQPDGKFNFPGIEGFINYYGSFYVPGVLNSTEVYLHYNSLYDIFLNFGDEQVYVGNSGGIDTTVTLDDAVLSGLLDYSSMNEKTIPLRLGLENISEIIGTTTDADVFSVTDISGSMGTTCSGSNFWCCLFNGMCRTQSTCESCGGTWENKLDLAKEANIAFINTVLNYSGNRVGLTAYSDEALNENYHALSNDTRTLEDEVNEWVAGGATCICCGINKAVTSLVADSAADKFRSMVVMSDGDANVVCSEQGTGSATQDAIEAACDAWTDHEIKVYAVGFGSDADQATLQSIASCGNGEYYYGDIDDLVGIYEQIAEDILNAQYVEQTIVGEGANTILYPDSYVSLSYDADLPYGLIVTAESDEFGNSISEGSFFVPEDAEPYDVKAISYSGSKWTDNVYIYDNVSSSWENIYNLSSYSSLFTELGDPYSVHIPLDKIHLGENTIRTTVGVSKGNSSGGSPYNKIIYSLVKDISSYSPIVLSAEGCSWNIEFENGVNQTMNIPSGYIGAEECYYTSNQISYNNNDAIQYAIYLLLVKLDLDSDGRIDILFSENDLSLSSTDVQGIPIPWETEVQIRVWR